MGRSVDEAGSVGRGPRVRARSAAALMVVVATVASIATSEVETDNQVGGMAAADVSLTPAVPTVDFDVTATASAEAIAGGRTGELDVVLYITSNDQQPAMVRVGSSDTTATWLGTADRPDGGGAGNGETTVVAPGTDRVAFHLRRSPAFVTCPPAASCLDRLRLRATLVGAQPARIIVDAVARIRWGTKSPPSGATVKVMVQESQP